MRVSGERSKKKRRRELLRLWGLAKPQPRHIRCIAFQPGDDELLALPSVFMQQHCGGIKAEPVPGDARKKHYRVTEECWLDRYFRRDLIDCEQRAAGLVYRDAWLTFFEGVKTYDSIANAGMKIDAQASEEDQKDLRFGAEKVLHLCNLKMSGHQKNAVIACCAVDEALCTRAKIRTLQRGLRAICERSKLLTPDENRFVEERLEKYLKNRP